MISLRKVLFLALLVPAAGQETLGPDAEATEAPDDEPAVTTTEAEVEIVPPACEGDILSSVANGCVSADVCAEMAQGMGLQLGNELYPYEADWVDKGCFYFPANHPLYPGQAYFGTGGTCAQLRIRPAEGGIRMSCDGRTQAPFDAERCEGNICVTAEDCEANALAMGLQLGNSLYPFEGPWIVKGCVYFPANHPEFPNQAYFGNGADICGQLRANPNDGSIRITCEAGAEDIVLPEPEPEPADSETLAPSAESTTAEPEPAVETEAPEPAVETEAPEPAVETEAPEPAVDTEAPEPAVNEPLVAESNITETETELVATPVVPSLRPTPVPAPLNITTPAEPDVVVTEPEVAPQVEATNVTQPAAVPEAVPEEPALSPIEANVQDKNDKAQKDDKANIGVDPLEDEDGDLGDTELTISRIEGAESTSDAAVATELVSFLSAFVFAWFM